MPINNVESYLKKRYDTEKNFMNAMVSPLCMVRVLAEYIWEEV
jgi:hypothetical protein